MLRLSSRRMGRKNKARRPLYTAMDRGRTDGVRGDGCFFLVGCDAVCCVSFLRLASLHFAAMLGFCYGWCGSVSFRWIMCNGHTTVPCNCNEMLFFAVGYSAHST